MIRWISRLTRRSLANRLQVLVIGTILLAGAGMATTLVYLDLGTSREEATGLTTQTAEHLADEFRTDVEPIYWALVTTAAELERQVVERSTDRMKVEGLLASAMEAHAATESFWTTFAPNAYDGQDRAWSDRGGFDHSGRVRVAVERVAGRIGRVDASRTTLVDAETLFPAGRNAGAVVEDPETHAEGGRTSMEVTFALPVHDAGGTVIGATGATVYLAELQQRLAAVRPLGSGYVSLYSTNGTVVSHPDPQLQGTRVRDIDAFRAAVAATRGNQPYTLVEHDDFLEGQRCACSSRS